MLGLTVTENQTNENEIQNVASGFVEFLIPPTIVFGLLFNTISAILMRRPKQKMFRVRVVLYLLAIADNGVLLTYYVFWWLEEITDGKVQKLIPDMVCRLHFFLGNWMLLLSSWCLVLICGERMTACYFPVEYKQLFSVANLKKILTLLTVLTGLASSFNFFATAAHNGYCWFHPQYKFFFSKVRPWLIASAVSLVPCLLIITGNGLIIFKINKREKAAYLRRCSTSQLDIAQQRRGSISSTESLTKTLLSVTILFVALTLPSFISNIIWHNKYINQDPDQNTITRAIDKILKCFNAISHSMNFLVYIISSPGIRRDFYSMCSRCSQNEENTRRNSALFSQTPDPSRSRTQSQTVNLKELQKMLPSLGLRKQKRQHHEDTASTPYAQNGAASPLYMKSPIDSFMSGDLVDSRLMSHACKTSNTCTPTTGSSADSLDRLSHNLKKCNSNHGSRDLLSPDLYSCIRTHSESSHCSSIPSMYRRNRNQTPLKSKINQKQLSFRLIDEMINPQSTTPSSTNSSDFLPGHTVVGGPTRELKDENLTKPMQGPCDYEQKGIISIGTTAVSVRLMRPETVDDEPKTDEETLIVKSPKGLIENYDSLTNVTLRLKNPEIIGPALINEEDCEAKLSFFTNTKSPPLRSKRKRKFRRKENRPVSHSSSGELTWV